MVLEDGELFISDLGRNKDMTIDGKPATLGRYAVIKNIQSDGTLHVVEVGADLEFLLKKYGIEKSKVGRIVY